MSHEIIKGLPHEAVTALLKWWKPMTADDPPGPVRADRANLRRAVDLDAVALLPAFQRVYRELRIACGGGEWPAHQQERIAAAVALLARLKASGSFSLPIAMSQHAEGSDRNLVSALRFRRLLDAHDIADLFLALRRVLPLIERTTEPQTLITDVFCWGEKTRKAWAYQYEWPQN